MHRLLAVIFAPIAPALPMIAACDAEPPAVGVCDPQKTGTPRSGECDCDDQCPEGTLCRFGFFGEYCGEGILCATDQSCPPAAECRLRDDCPVLVGTCASSRPSSLATRKTCERRRCNCDADCPEGYVCGSSPAAFGEVCVVGALCASDTDCAVSRQCVTEPRPACSAPRTGCRSRPCGSDSDCPVGTICNPMGNECV